MEFGFTPEEEAFRREIRAFLRAELPPDWGQQAGVGALGEGGDSRWEFLRQFQKKLAAKGWLTLGWPAEPGGLAATDMMQGLCNEDKYYHRGPTQHGDG